MGSSRKDLRAFPAEARGEAGHDLFLVQKRKSPRDWKPMRSVGPGASEIRIQTWSGARLEHRVVYVRTAATASQDLETARDRYREMLARRAKES